MIISEDNRLLKIRQSNEKIRSLWDITLPSPYTLVEDKDDNYKLKIKIKGWFDSPYIAELEIDEDIILIRFTREEAEYLNILRKYFEESKNKFKVIVGDYY